MRSATHRSAPLVPDFLWRWIGWLLVLFAAITGAFAYLTNGEVGPRAWEQRVIDALRDPDMPQTAYRVGVDLGAPAFFAAVVIVLAAWAIARRSWPALVACATVPGAVLLVEEILKPLVDRRSPWNDYILYPSGTATGVAAWTTLVWLLAMPVVRGRGARVALTTVLVALTVLTAISVVGTNRHYPLDAVGGVATGMGVVLGCAALIDLVTGAHRRDEPDAVETADRPTASVSLD